MRLKIWQSIGILLGIALIAGVVIPLVWTIFNSATASFIIFLLVIAVLGWQYDKKRKKRPGPDYPLPHRNHFFTEEEDSKNTEE